MLTLSGYSSESEHHPKTSNTDLHLSGQDVKVGTHHATITIKEDVAKAKDCRYTSLYVFIVGQLEDYSHTCGSGNCSVCVL